MSSGVWIIASEECENPRFFEDFGEAIFVFLTLIHERDYEDLTLKWSA